MEAAEAIAPVKGHIEHELLLRNEYLAAENEILKSKLEGRLLFTTEEKVRLARLGKEIGRRGLKDIGCIVTPDTILRWYRELIAKKFDGSKHRKSSGRPRTDAEIEELVCRLATENPRWGYSHISGELRKLKIARNETMEGIGFLNEVKYVIHDRDGKYCPAFDGILKSAGKKPVKLPARSPNLNAFAERWVLSCKSECTRRILVIGEDGVWRAIQEFIAHYHTERPHQGLGNVVPTGWPDDAPDNGRIECDERLGGLLKSYRRVA